MISVFGAKLVVRQANTFVIDQGPLSRIYTNDYDPNFPGQKQGCGVEGSEYKTADKKGKK